MNSIKEQLSYEVYPLFPLPIYKTNIAREFTKEEQDELDVIISEQLVKFKGSTFPKHVDDYTKNISEDKYLLNRKSFLSIHSFIQQHLKEFVTTVMGCDTAKASWAPYITHSWLNAYGPDQYEERHNHRNCIISGVFYINCLEVSDKPDGIVFSSPSHQMLESFLLPKAQDTIFSDQSVPINVIPGDLILFPSNAMHSVNLNETSDQTRISLSFNSL